MPLDDTAWEAGRRQRQTAAAHLRAGTVGVRLVSDQLAGAEKVLILAKDEDQAARRTVAAAERHFEEATCDAEIDAAERALIAARGRRTLANRAVRAAERSRAAADRRSRAALDNGTFWDANRLWRDNSEHVAAARDLFAACANNPERPPADRARWAARLAALPPAAPEEPPPPAPALEPSEPPARLPEPAAAPATPEKRAKKAATPAAVPPQRAEGRVEGPYTMTAAGLFWNDPEDHTKPRLWLSDPFEVVAETRDNNGDAWGLLVQWQDRDRRPHEWALPRAMLAGDCSEMRARFADGGLNIAPSRKGRELFAAYLAHKHTENRARCVEATGWHGSAYVTPKEVFGHTAGEKVILQTIAAIVTDFDTKGTFDEWKREVAALAVGNSRLALALSVAFVGPLLHLVGEESHGFHFSGGSSSGKTTALRAAASVWGVPIHTWRTTDNAAEGRARAANDGLLLLDELSQVDGRAADAMAYMLGNGQGKGRMRQDATNKPLASWRLAFLSTGEVGLAEKIGEAGKRAKAGQSVRLIEIPADAGAGLKLFETLHRFTEGDALARHLRTATDAHRGHAMRPFLAHITANLSAVTDALRDDIRRWLADNLPPKADGQVSRVASRFALAAAAGQLAADTGILPWPKGEAGRAAAVCFKAWLVHRGGTGAAETEAGLSQVRAFIEMHGEARFAPIGTDDKSQRVVVNRAGFVREDDTGRLEYLVLPEAWRNEVCKGLDAKAVARDLADRGLLVPGSDGGLSRTERIPGAGKPRVYRITSDILAQGA